MLHHLIFDAEEIFLRQCHFNRSSYCKLVSKGVRSEFQFGLLDTTIPSKCKSYCLLTCSIQWRSFYYKTLAVSASLLSLWRLRLTYDGIFLILEWALSHQQTARLRLGWHFHSTLGWHPHNGRHQKAICKTEWISISDACIDMQNLFINRI